MSSITAYSWNWSSYFTDQLVDQQKFENNIDDYLVTTVIPTRHNLCKVQFNLNKIKHSTMKLSLLKPIRGGLAFEWLRADRRKYQKSLGDEHLIMHGDGSRAHRSRGWAVTYPVKELKALSYPFMAFLDLWCIVQQLQHVLMPALTRLPHHKFYSPTNHIKWLPEWKGLGGGGTSCGHL